MSATDNPLLKERYRMPGARFDALKNPELYEKLRGEGKTKESAAKISNAARLGAIQKQLKKG